MTSVISPRRLLQEMFSEMVVKKVASLIPHYYHPDFLLFTNGQTQSYRLFAEGHKKMYATSITYEVTYDEDTWVESAGKVAVRCWIKTQLASEDAVEYEVVLIGTYVDQKLHRLWELTWPDWRTAEAFEKYPETEGNEG
jgi:hypothetical protein